MSQGNEVAIFGAGNIGRGVVAARVSAAGLRPQLIEKNMDLVQKLATARAYNVHLVGGSQSTSSVTGFRMLSAADVGRVARAISRCRFAATAVGGAHLTEVAPMLAAGLAGRGEPLNIMICENLSHADELLREELRKHGASAHQFFCVRASVEPMFRGIEGSLDLMGEDGLLVYVDRAAWQGEELAVPGIEFVDNVDSFYARKLFTNNAGHALVAYMGARIGCRFIHEAAQAPEIRPHLEELLDVASKALVCQYGLGEVEMRKHVESLLAYRFPNRALEDTVTRVGRDPLRKLRPGERLVGLARLLQSCGLPTRPISRAIGAALHYYDCDDQSSVLLQDMIREDGLEGVLQSVCGFTPDEPCFAECVAFYSQRL